MTTLPTTLAMIATSITATTAFASNADFNNDGIVDTSDLIAVTSNIGACDGDCPTDLNTDGVTDQQDVLVLMQSWGAVEGWTASDNASSEEDSQTPNRDLSWIGQGPVLLDAIYYDQLSSNDLRSSYAEQLSQGEQTKAWVASNNVEVQPMVYHGGVDRNVDGVYTEQEKEAFAAWIIENVPADYTGPICLDMEGPRWIIWNTDSQEVMDGLIDFYIEGLEFAQSLRPNAKIGYFGLPKQQHTNPAVETASVQRILEASTALFPNVYEFNPGHDASNRLQGHIAKTIEWVKGQVPVYVQVSPRFRDSDTQAMLLHDQEEVMRDQVNSSLSAEWTDDSGQAHKIAGVSLWDAYTFVSSNTEDWSTLDNDARKSMWDDLDTYHVCMLGHMKNAVDEVCGSMQSQDNEAAESQVAAEEAAVQAATEALETSRQHRAQVLAQLRTVKASFKNTRTSYVKAQKTYRSWSSARKSYKKALAAAKKRFKKNKNRSAYKKAVAKAKRQFSNKRNSFRSAARSFRSQRASFRTVRANWNTAKGEWRTANASWQQMRENTSTLLASN